MKTAIVCDNRRWASPAEPFRALAQGLRRLGHQVEAVAPGGGWPLLCPTPDAAFVWNGVHARWADIAGRLRRQGVRTFVMERGFFDRFNHTQIDPQGFNHTASWAAELSQPAPPSGWRRLLRVWGCEPTPLRRVRNGLVLVLCQMPGDAQLRDSDIRHPGPLVRAVEDATPPGIDIRVRAHPLSAWSCGTIGRSRMIGGALKDSLAGAGFAVTVNSNAGNEALAWGCPLLCLGPALYAKALVAMQTKLADLPAAIEAMLAGAKPAQGDVENYLCHLAARQWSSAELSDGRVLEGILSADAPVPGGRDGRGSPAGA